MKLNFFYTPAVIFMAAGLCFSCTSSESFEADLSQIISRGNIVVTEYQAEAEVGSYLANGRFGAVMSGLGLNLTPEEQTSQRNIGHSQFSHLNHWGRFRFTSAIEHQESVADYLLPFFRLYWEHQPETVTDYCQEQNMYDGFLRTNFTTPSGEKVEVVDWFDMINKNIAGISIDLSEGNMPIRAEICSNFQAYPFVFRDNVEQTCNISRDGDAWRIEVSCPQTLNHVESTLYFYSSAPVEACDNGLRILVSPGHNQIFISYGQPATSDDRHLSFDRTKEVWHQEWAKSGWMDMPDDNAQKTFVRSMAYMLSTYNDFELGMFQPTNGFTCNPFPFHYVQDLEYIAPAMMLTGHNDIIMQWVEKFANEIEAHRAYARHLWPETQGIYPPWELPFGSVDGYHDPYVPVAFCYEPHNVGYLARLAMEAGETSGDTSWIEQYVKPLLQECALFYLSACKKQDDGLWHMSWYPCIGQDEAGGRNKTDYLCSFYSAEYTFRSAIALGLDKDGQMANILSDGLAYQSLMSERGTYHTCHGADDFGKQKHPVQLDGLAYFPINLAPLEPEAKAYSLRHDITDRARDPHFFGWTLGQFLLSGSNMKDPEGWLDDWSKMRASDYTDSNWKQIYETSRNHGAAFYVTTHGMVLQSLIRNYVNDYWGTLDIAGCPAFSTESIRFGNITTRFGVTVSGYSHNGKFHLKLHADRDTNFVLHGKEMNMKAGAEEEVLLSL